MASWSACAHGEGVSPCPGAGEKGANACRSEAPRADPRFPRSRRLTVRRQFLAVYGRGARIASASFVLFAMPNGLDGCRLGVTVPRKVGSAVVRNRVKRRLREVFRTHRAELQPPLDLVINVTPRVAERPTRELEREFLAGFERLAVKLGERRR